MAHCCPKCGSREIALVERGYNIKKGLLGIVTLGWVGGLAGLHGSKKLLWVCSRCNAHFNEPATAANFSQQPAIQVEPAITAQQVIQEAEHKAADAKLKANRTPPVVKQRLVCACGAYNSIYNSSCFSCGKPLSLQYSQRVPAMPAKVVLCTCGTKNELTHKHCTACGAWLDYSQLQQQDGTTSYTSQQCPHCNVETPAKSRKVKFCAHCGQAL